MGYDLNATIGFGVKIEEFEQDSLLTAEEYDLVEELVYTEDSSLYIEYAGTDECRATYILHKNSILSADWLGTSFNSEELIDNLQQELIYGSALQKELQMHNIIISGELFKWWILPLWF